MAGYETFYEGSTSPLQPAYGDYFTKYQMGATKLGFPGSPSTANQLGEAVNAIKQGVQNFEISLLGIQGDVDQTMPKQHFQEIRALMKLSGVKPSVHGPVVDAAGFTERGWGGDMARADNERRMFDAIEKAHILDPEGKIPVVLHSTNGVPGREYVPDEDGKSKIQKITAINLETNQLATQFEDDYMFSPRHPEDLDEKGSKTTIEEHLESANRNEWENKLTDLASFAKHADEVIRNNTFNLGEYYKDALIISDEKGAQKIVKVENGKEIKLPNFTNEQSNEYQKLREADIFLSNVQLNFNTAFHKAFKYAGEDENGKQKKEELKKLADEYSKSMKQLGEYKQIKDGKKFEVQRIWNPVLKRDVLEKAIRDLQKITDEHGAPKIYQDVEDFALKKATETFSNLAVKSYDQYKDKAPILAIENLYQGMAFSRAEDLKKIVDETRENYKKYLVEQKNVKPKEAEQLAKEKIGVTWDVGHLNLMKKKGFNDKDMIKETEVISGDKSMVKHIHLTDNFGFSDSHLPPGMGNVPIKGILEVLERTGRLDEMKKIVEAGNFVQHFKKSPHPWTLAAFNSPIYGMKEGYAWGQAFDNVGSYFGGYGTLNPQGHHSLYGAGFSNLPTELGGNMPGAGQGQSRFGNTPMA